MTSLAPLRILVVGTSGSGKSTLARRLGAALELPVIELDAINWQPGWRDLDSHDPEAFLRRVAEATAAERWVCDGNYRRVQPLILERATDVVWLDYPRWVVMRQVIWRSASRALTRKELWPGTGNVERWSRWLDPGHPIRWAWDTFKGRRARYGALFASLEQTGVRTHRLRRPAEARDLAARLRGAAVATPA